VVTSHAEDFKVHAFRFLRITHLKSTLPGQFKREDPGFETWSNSNGLDGQQRHTPNSFRSWPECANARRRRAQKRLVLIVRGAIHKVAQDKLKIFHVQGFILHNFGELPVLIGGNNEGHILARFELKLDKASFSECFCLIGRIPGNLKFLAEI